ncbi:DUF885 family protein [Sphingopyxis sp. SCN 67-31]|uniref:DUF885 domain-containing protein n=1 Tax=Sphingopyxis sp. SCN 67-31 TaxID=1660142 RepID=UPI000869403E|nr:DUF885 family protein [Sphingopyxis sp. SCN 67-31]ODU34443.1 MAG: bacteriochlorophyll 4-vinyl reductase [Sphingopyxis sp. SCN 67-31]
MERYLMRRRDLLTGAAALGATLSLTGCASAGRAVGTSADVRLAAMLERHAQALRDEESGPDRLGDYSLAARARARQTNAARLAELNGVDRSALSPAAALDYDTARFVYGAMDDQYGRYGFSDINLRPSPYVVSQMNGAYYWLPDGIAGRSPLANEADAERYLDKLRQLVVALDQETEQIAHDAGLGVVPPAFILAKTVAQIATLRDMPAASNPLIGPAVARARAAGLNDLESRAAAIFAAQVAPALTRQMAALDALRPRADDRAGVWAKPDGEAYYASGLHSNTTAGYAPAELHRLGLTWVAELTAEIDRLLRAQGLTEGSVAARMSALDRDPRFLKADSDAGRREIIDYATARLARIRNLLPRGFAFVPDLPVEVRRVSPAIEKGAPGGFYSASSDPAQPSVIYINLRSVEENALWRIPTLLHHEGIPGHHFQASVLKEAGKLSLFRRTVRFSAWTEGWALYAEQLAAEIGAYDDDPTGRIGYLQGQLFRACRVVVDTGIHHARWTREQAIDWMVANAGENRDAAERDIDRYCVYPGQACSFMVGKQQIVDLREKARADLGSRFDSRAYNDMVLASGPLPMEVLGAAVDQWTTSLQGA